MRLFKQVCVIAVLSAIHLISFSQTSFIKEQITYPRVEQAFRSKEDSLKKQFEKAKLIFPQNKFFFVVSNTIVS